MCGNNNRTRSTDCEVRQAKYEKEKETNLIGMEISHVLCRWYSNFFAAQEILLYNT